MRTRKKSTVSKNGRKHRPSQVRWFVMWIVFTSTWSYVTGEEVCATLEHYHIFAKKPPQEYKYCSNQCCGTIYLRYCCNTPWLLPAVIVVCSITVFVIIGIVIYFLCRSKRRKSTSSVHASNSKAAGKKTATLHEKSETVTYTISHPGSSSRNTEKSVLEE